MNEMQRIALTESFQKQLQYLEDSKEIIKEYNKLRNCFKDTLVDNKECDFIISGNSKSAILLKYKEQLNMSQKDLLSIIKPIDLYDYVYDTNLKEFDRYKSKLYRVDQEHDKFKSFMLSIGLIDNTFKKGYILDRKYSTNIEYYISMPNEKISPAHLVSFFNSMINVAKMKVPTDTYALNNYIFTLDKVMFLWNKIENYGLEKLKARVLADMELEKSK